MFGFLKSGLQKIAQAMTQAMTRTRSALGSKIRALFKGSIDDSTYEQLEQILYEADLGTRCASSFVEKLRSSGKTDIDDILHLMEEEAVRILSEPPRIHASLPAAGQPLVVLIVGVNGSGKTTSLAKLAHSFHRDGKKVLLAAGDTFRAAAIDQLETWANRIGVEIVKGKPGGDPSGVVFDALHAALARKADVVFIDTAGRLQNKTDLMQELEKIRRICTKVIPGSPHETWLVLDATTGQNAIDQAATFNQFTPLSGLILSKLDGSAKGGIVLSIYQDLHIPVRWIGIGEGVDDLLPFDPAAYSSSLFDTAK
jgi:fused signal recognition particle receptor